MNEERIQVYCGGLGKSGIEAMFFNSAVITTGSVPLTYKNEEIPLPPVKWSSYDTALEDIEELVINKDAHRIQVENQKEWIKKYLSLEYVGKYFVDNIVKYSKKK